MAVTWQAVQLDRQLKDGDKDDVVTTVHWTAIDSEVDGENTYSGRAYGSVGLAAPGDSFTPYSNISEEQQKEGEVLCNQQLKRMAYLN